MKSNSISIISNRRRISLSPEDILYVQLVERQSVIHVFSGRTYETYTTIDELAQMLGSGFLRADRATLVSARGVRTIGKKIELINGELLSFTRRRKRELKEQLRAGRRQIVQELAGSDAPTTREEYQRHYDADDVSVISGKGEIMEDSEDFQVLAITTMVSSFVAEWYGRSAERHHE